MEISSTHNYDKDSIAWYLILIEILFPLRDLESFSNSGTCHCSLFLTETKILVESSGTIQTQPGT